ncbi:hypothetical protein OG2516_13139 [Oceanicola granulosus HTCC2516]|uniref:Sarcosine oxidase, gamma subunit family protein n=1 Tax=Oceanicola granulosus (strain ATCC BAA-861 / DSM 15982 / KCTC 12143 / HTCC2516) TaxID=314256 RepID=Q2CH40_OCEGH|nr:sarcosine oxidase subunit gamma family protein [Oceanicola granulosus]EAR51971.1 hypothetical protein OG2516_13139 [Oceanicola granulosus HTCC2516]
MNAPVSALTPGPLVETDVVRVSLEAPRGRLSLRARGELAPFDVALGLTLPRKIGQRAAGDGIEALCLGPDEWMIHAPEAQVGALLSACATLYERHPHSLVDVSGRETTYVVDGPGALDLLSVGCPRDLDRILPGEGRRTVFDGVTVILWRDGETTARLDVWHSFAPYLSELLETGSRELAADAAAAR